MRSRHCRLGARMFGRQFTRTARARLAHQVPPALTVLGGSPVTNCFLAPAMRWSRWGYRTSAHRTGLHWCQFPVTPFHSRYRKEETT